MSDPQPATAFISFSSSDPLSNLLRNEAEKVLRQLGFDPWAYKGPSKEPQEPNYNADAAEASLRNARRAAITVLIVVPTYYGWIVPKGMVAGADGMKSICWLEYEAACTAGRHVIAMILSSNYRETFEVEHQRLLLAGLELPQEDITGLRQLRAMLVAGRPNTVEYGSVANFGLQLRANLKHWLDTRTLVVDLPPEIEHGALPRASFTAALTARMVLPGLVGVLALRGMGATTSVCAAARAALRKDQFRHVIHVDCRARTRDQVAADICRAIGGVAEADRDMSLAVAAQELLRNSRSLLILDGASPHCLDVAPRGSSHTTVVITDDRRTLRAFGIAMDEWLEVPRLNQDESETFLSRHILSAGGRSGHDRGALARIAGMLHGWPCALQVAAQMIVDDELHGDSAPRVLSALSGSGILALLDADSQQAESGLLRDLVLGRLAPADRRRLAALSVLPERGFALEVASLALGVEPDEAGSVIMRLIRFLCVRRSGRRQYRLEPEPRELAWRDDDLEALRLAAHERVERGIVERVAQLSSSRGDLVNLLLPDVGLVLAVVDKELARHPMAARELMPGIGALVRRTGSWEIAGEILGRLLLPGRLDIDPDTRAHLLFGQGVAQSRRRDPRPAQGALRQALELARSQGLAGMVPRIQTALARTHARLGEHQEAVALLGAALQIERQDGQPRFGTAIVLHQIGHSYRCLRMFREARDHVAESIAIGNSLADVRHLSHAHVTLAGIEAAEGRMDAALAELSLAYSAAQKDSNPHQMVVVAQRRVELLSESGRVEEARAALEAAAELLRDVPVSPMAMMIYDTQDQLEREHGAQWLGTERYRELIRSAGSPRDRLAFTWRLLTAAAGDKGAEDPTGIVDEVPSDYEAADPRQAAKLRNVFGKMLRRARRFEAAIRWHEAALEIARAGGDLRSESMTVGELSSALADSGRTLDGIKLLRDHLAPDRRNDNGRAMLLTRLGVLLDRQREFAAALSCLEEAVQMERAGGEGQPGLAVPLHALAHSQVRQRKAATAIPLLNEALDIETKLGTRRGKLKVLHTLARAQIETGSYVDAETSIRLSLRLAEGEPDPFHECQVVRTWARICRLRGERAEEQAKLEESLRVATSNKEADPRLAVHAMVVRVELAACLARGEHILDAGRLLRESIDDARELGTVRSFLFASRRYAELQASHRSELGDPIATLAQAVEVGVPKVVEGDIDLELARAIRMLARLLIEVDRPAEALSLIDRAQQITGAPAVWLEARRQRGRMLWSQGDRAGARAHYRASAQAALASGNHFAVRRLALDFVHWLLVARDVVEADELLAEVDRGLLSGRSEPNHRFAIVMRRAALLCRIERFDQALDACAIAHSLALQMGSEHLVGVAAAQAAECHMGKGDDARAAELLIGEYERLEQAAEEPVGAPGGSLQSRAGDDASDHAIRVARLLRRVDMSRAREFLRSRFTRVLAAGPARRVVVVARELARLEGERAFHREAEEVLLRAEEATRAAGDADAAALVWQELAELAQRWGEHEQATMRYEKCIELRRKAGNPVRTAWSLRKLAIHCRHNMDDVGRALDHARKALALQRDLPPHRALVFLLNSTGALLKDLGATTESIETLREAASLADELEDEDLQGASRLTLAAALHAGGRSDDARRQLERALEVLEGERDSTTFAYALRTLGQSLYEARHGPAAVRVLRQFKSHARVHDYGVEDSFGARGMLAGALRVSGLLPEALAEVDEALAELDQRADLQPGSPTARALRSALRSRRAQVLLDMNRPAEALAILERVHSEQRQTAVVDDDEPRFPFANHVARAKAHAMLGDRRRSMKLLTLAGSHVPDDQQERAIHNLDRSLVLWLGGDLAAARIEVEHSLQRAAEVPGRYERRLTQAFALIRAASIALAQGEKEALAVAERALQEATDTGSPQAFVEACVVRGRALLAGGRCDDAAAIARRALERERSDFELAGFDPGQATRPGVELVAILAAATAASRDPVANEVAADFDRRRTQLESRGVVFLPYELLQSNQREVEPVRPRAAPGVDERPLEQGARVLGKILRILDEGTTPGVLVQLHLGQTGFAATKQLFVGSDGLPSRRFSLDDVHAFTVESVAGEMVAGTRVRLSQVPFLLPVMRSLTGKVVLAKAQHVHKVDQRVAITFLMTCGQFLTLDLQHQVGWGGRDQFRRLWNEQCELPIALRFDEKGVVRLTGSLKEIYTSALEVLRSAAEPVAGTVVAFTEERVAVSLAPGVTATCPMAEYAPGNKQRVSIGDRISVIIEKLTPTELRVSRKRALTRQLQCSGGRTLAGTIVVRRPGLTLVELAPSVVGRLDEGLGGPGFPHDSDLEGTRVAVSLSHSNHESPQVRSGKAPHHMRLVRITLVDTGKAESLEQGADLLQRLPAVQCDPRDLIREALQVARRQVERDVGHDPAS